CPVHRHTARVEAHSAEWQRQLGRGGPLPREPAQRHTVRSYAAVLAPEDPLPWERQQFSDEVRARVRSCLGPHRTREPWITLIIPAPPSPSSPEGGGCCRDRRRLGPPRPRGGRRDHRGDRL